MKDVTADRTSATRRSGTIKFGIILDGVGTSSYGWAQPDVSSRASVDIADYLGAASRAERACFDFAFIADTLFVDGASPPHLLNRLEPISLLGALAAATSRIGLVATVSTLFADPFNAARQLASLDLISDGRMGWNIVTSAVPKASLNFSKPADFGQGDRYERAAEHVSVVKGLWDSWEDDAFPYDRANLRFHDPSRLHRLDHAGRFYQVAGPLNVQRSRQGQPVLFQAGSSGAGRDLAARFADAIFAMTSDMGSALEYAGDVRARATTLGRKPAEILFMPRITPITGVTRHEVEERYRAFARLADPHDAMRLLGRLLGRDLSEVPLGKKISEVDIDALPPLGGFDGPDRLAYLETREGARFMQDAIGSSLTMEEAALECMTPRTSFVGTADEVADECERWFRHGAADGFIIRGGDCEDFIDEVLPRLRDRGLARSGYDTDTLRGHLGLQPVPNRYAAVRQTSTITEG